MEKPITVTFNTTLTLDEAWALAQFVKRVDRGTCETHAGSASEADLIFEAMIGLREALREAGYAPR